MTDSAGTNGERPGGREARERAALDAYTAAGQAVVWLGRQAGVPLATRPVWPGATTTIEEPPAGPAIRIARGLEHAAAQVTRGYIRRGRETGLSWHEIGLALELGPNGGTAASVAQAAFEYAAGWRRASDRYDDHETPSFGWTCPGCESYITDFGPGQDPAASEPGHAPGCERQTADVAAWQAGHQAGQS